MEQESTIFLCFHNLLTFFNLSWDSLIEPREIEVMQHSPKNPFNKRRIAILSGVLSAMLVLLAFQITMNHKKIDSHGFWVGDNVVDEHYTDYVLAKKLVTFFKERGARTVIDLGAGMGEYAKLFNESGIFTSCFDGNPDTQSLSQGRCAVVDLAQPIALPKHDWVLSLEVGEHLPPQYEDTFLKNLDAVNVKGVVLSWAVPGQAGQGHFNLRSNAHIKEKLAKMGYVNDIEAEKSLREGLKVNFDKTLMVFVRP